MAEIRIINQTVDLDGLLIPALIPGTLCGGEALAHKFVISATRNGTPVALSGTVSGVCLRFADNASVALTGAIESGKAAVTLPATCYALDGCVRITIFVTADGATVASWSCDTHVRLSETDQAVDPGTIIPSVSALISDIDAAVASVPADYSDLLAAIAPTYSNASTYAVGDYVWYDGDLYRCTTAISTAESWTAAHWESAVLSEDVDEGFAELKSAVNDKLDAPSTAGTAGQALVTDGNGNVSWANVEIEVDATLSQSGEAADAKATGDEITELESALDDFEDGYTPGSTIHLNLLDTAELTSTTQYYRVNNSGQLVFDTASTATYNSYIISVKPEQLYTANHNVRYIIPLDSDKSPLVASAIGSVTSIDTTNYPGTVYLAVSIRNNDGSFDIDDVAFSEGSTPSQEVITVPLVLPGWASDKFSEIESDLSEIEDDVTNIQGDITEIETDVSGLSSDLTAFKDGYDVVTLDLLDDLTPTSTTQYYSKSSQTGKLAFGTGATATYNSWLVPVDGISKYTMSYVTRFVFAVAEDGETVIGDALSNVTSIETINYTSCKYIAVSVRNDNAQEPMSGYYISKGDTARTGTETILPGWCNDRFDDVENQIAELDAKPKRNKIYMLTDTSFNAEKNFSGFATSVKSKCLHIVVNPSLFTSLTVGLRDATRAIFYAKVTSDSVYLYDYNGGLTEHTQTYTHGLTIADNISIDVYAAANTGAYYVKVGTNGTEYVTPTAFNVAPTGLIYPYASMEGAATFVQFCVECNTQRPIWLYGDSYLGTNNPARWAYYLVNREQDSRIMMDAYAGENSTNAYASLEKMIECGVPDYLVWCLGMNDGNDTGTTPNNTWLSKVESVIALCEANNITPILATIPTVPSVNNEGKNKWVRESGYQYVDFAKAVGASDQGVWFDGMLSSDNVHPSITGAITLYHAALAGCPQFSQK